MRLLHANGYARPDDSCYRIPGTRIFAGEYPALDGEIETRQKLDRFLDFGITSWLDLTSPDDPLDPYEPMLAARAASRRVQVEYRRMPITDRSVPTPAIMRAILDSIDDAHRRGHAIYVHCWGGIGRTGIVIACHLTRRGDDADSALATLATLFQTVGYSRLHPRSPQTDEQFEFVRAWREHPADSSGMPDAGARGGANRTEGRRTLHSRYFREQLRGALVGLAVGDALGTTVEFSSPGSFEPVTDMTGGGPFSLQPGEWTDDTSMALCLAESLIERGGMDLEDQARRYLRWWNEGHLSSTGRCFDIGVQTREALEQFRRSGNPRSGPASPERSGNGSIMRLAPVPMRWALYPRTALDASAESSLSTHGSDMCLDACRYLAGLIVGAVTGFTKSELLAPCFSPVPGYWKDQPLAPEIREVAEGSFKHRDPPEIAGTGFVVRSLEAALWAFHRSSSFEEGALMAVNLGDDADTTGAVYGQLAGAYYGEEGIPRRWRERLALRPTIDRLAEGLFEAAVSSRQG